MYRQTENLSEAGRRVENSAERDDILSPCFLPQILPTGLMPPPAINHIVCFSKPLRAEKSAMHRFESSLGALPRS